MTVSIQEFNEVRGEVDSQVKAALGVFAERMEATRHPAFEIERAASEIEQIFERQMVEEFRGLRK